jgi:hypothetical protein
MFNTDLMYGYMKTDAQVKFEFRHDPMIFDRVILKKFSVSTLYLVRLKLHMQICHRILTWSWSDDFELSLFNLEKI